MVHQDSFTPQEYAKIVGMFPDPPSNPLPTGGYMDEGFDWVVHQAEFKSEYECDRCEEEVPDGEGRYPKATGSDDDTRICEDCYRIEPKFSIYQAEAVPISEEEELLVVRNDMGQTKGFIEMDEDLEDDSVEIEISDDEMEEIAEIKLDAESKKSKSMFTKDKRGRMYARNRKGQIITHNSEEDDEEAVIPLYAETIREEYERQVGEIDDEGAKGLIRCSGCDEVTSYYDEMNYCDACQQRKKAGQIDEKGNWLYAEGDALNADFVKPSRDWLSLALGTAAVVIGGSLFLQNRGVFKADGDGTENSPSLVAHPSTGDLLPADYEEMVVESTGYAVPVIPVSLDPAFMGSRFHALPTDRVVESNEPGIGAHTDVAMTRDTNYREPEQTMVTEPPFAYKFNAENGCKCSLLDRIKSFFTGKSCCEVKEANSVTGQTPYFGVGFDGRNTQERVIKETNPVSLDPSTAPYIPTNLSGYTGQSYTPPSVYSDMMQIGMTGQTPSFVSSQSSIGTNRAGSRSVATSDSLQSVHGNLSAGVNQSYTDGSKTMSLSQWSIEYDVSQISDSEAFAVSRSSGQRTMIRRV